MDKKSDQKGFTLQEIFASGKVLLVNSFMLSSSDGTIEEVSTLISENNYVTGGVKHFRSLADYESSSKKPLS